MEPLKTIALDGPEKLTYVSTLLSSEEKKQLQHILFGNTYVFTWSHSDMVEIDPTLPSHKLNIIASVKPARSSSDYSDIGEQSYESRFYQRSKVF